MDNLNDLFQQKLYGAEVPPPPTVWPLVERELRRRRRRVLGWWLFAGVAVVGLAAYWSLQYAPQEQSVSSTMPPVSVAAKQGSDSNPATLGSTSPEADDQPAANAATLSDGVRSDGVRTKARQPGSALPSTSTFSAKGGLNQTLPTKLQKASPTVQPKAILPDPPPTAATSMGETTATVPPLSASPPAEPSSAAATLPDGEAAPRILELPTISSIDYTKLLGPAPAHITHMPLAGTKTRKKTNKHQHCYDFAAHPNVFLLDAYVGPSLARKELRTTTPEDSWYRQQRLSTEHRDWAFNGGLRATLLLNQHFLIRSGLHYDQIVEVFEYADPNYREVNIRQRSILVNGVWKTVSDTTVSYGEHYTKTYNRLGMLDIPLQVGVEIRNGRSGLSLQAGASLNVLFWKQGTLLSMTDQPISFEESRMFRPRAGLSVSGSVQWFYHLRKRTRVFAEPYYRQVLKPVSTTTQPVEQRYGIGGLRLGITQILD